MHNEAGERRKKKTANMQKRPRETYRIPVKSRSAQNDECVLNLKKRKTKEKKNFENLTKNWSETRVNHQDEFRPTNCLKMWITNERGRAQEEDDELNLIFIQFQV